MAFTKSLLVTMYKFLSFYIIFLLIYLFNLRSDKNLGKLSIVNLINILYD